MGLFSSRKQGGTNGTRVDSSTNYREPIVGSRRVSWDNTPTHSRRGSEARAVQGSSVALHGSQTDPTIRRDYSHSRQVSAGDQSTRSLRRKSYQTDTTSRSIDPEARSVRIRASDVFRMKPDLKFRQNVNYPTTPEGHLPTLRGGHSKSPFVDDLADELDTRQLRNVLDTDSRRRKRRQSALDEGRRGTRRHTSNFTHSGSRSNVPALRAFPDTRTPSTGRADSPDYITTGETPVYDRFMEIKRNTSNVPIMPNPITGTSEFWHDPEATQVTKSQSWKNEDSGIILAGNRESFPDFAVVDRSAGPARQSSSSGILTNAWSSLWRRASTARTKKENDVAQHRTKTLEQANTSGQMTEARQESEEIVVIPPSNGTTADVVANRHLSASSSVLYETLDDLPRPIIRDLPEASESPPHHIKPSYTTLPYAAEIPTDAFYDPNSTPRATSRATHSRNFSRPTNESRLGQYNNNQILVIKQEHEPSKTFSPLLSGDSFPMPEQRDPSTLRPGLHTKHSADGPIQLQNDNWDSTYPLTPLINNNSNKAHFTPGGFSSPVLAAGLSAPAPPGTSPTLPMTPNASAPEGDRYVPARALDYETNWVPSPPPSAQLESGTLLRPGLDRSYTRHSVNSMQSLDSEGSWLAKRRSDMDEIVRRSFSRNLDGRPGSSSSIISGLSRSLRPSSTASHLRHHNGFSDRSESESSADTDDERVFGDDSDIDAHLETPTDEDLNDEVEYEQGIWRTGIGRSVQVVSSSLEEGRPVVMDRAELPSVTHTRQNSKDMSEYTSANESRETVRLSDEQQLPPPRFVQRDSFLTSTASFHTAAMYSASASATTSRSTVNGHEY